MGRGGCQRTEDSESDLVTAPIIFTHVIVKIKNKDDWPLFQKHIVSTGLSYTMFQIAKGLETSYFMHSTHTRANNTTAFSLHLFTNLLIEPPNSLDCDLRHSEFATVQLGQSDPLKRYHGHICGQLKKGS